MVLNIINNISKYILSIKIKGSNINTRFVDCVATCDVDTLGTLKDIIDKRFSHGYSQETVGFQQSYEIESD